MQIKKIITLLTFSSIFGFQFLSASDSLVNHVADFPSLSHKTFAGFKQDSFSISSNHNNITKKTEKKVNYKQEQSNLDFMRLNLYFNTGEYKLNNMQKNKIKQTMESFLQKKKNKKIYIEIRGFADERGKFFSNKLLSLNRAKAVCNEIKKDLSNKVKKNIYIKAYGENKSFFNDKKNRRVEITFIAN